MTALQLLHDLRQDGVTVALEGAEVLVLTLPSAVVLRGALPVPQRSWSAGLFDLVEQHDDYTRMLRDCARLPFVDAEELSWRLVLAGYTAPGSGASH